MSHCACRGMKQLHAVSIISLYKHIVNYYVKKILCLCDFQKINMKNILMSDAAYQETVSYTQYLLVTSKQLHIL